MWLWPGFLRFWIGDDPGSGVVWRVWLATGVTDMRRGMKHAGAAGPGGSRARPSRGAISTFSGAVAGGLIGGGAVRSARLL